MSIGDIRLFLLAQDKIDNDCDLLEFGCKRFEGDSIWFLHLDTSLESVQIGLGLFILGLSLFLERQFKVLNLEFFISS